MSDPTDPREPAPPEGEAHAEGLGSPKDDDALRPAGDAPEERRSAKRTAALTLTATGVVFGDIGTSPLYAIRECFHGDYATEVSRANVFGVVSLIFWTLLLVVCVKYLVFVLRADNDGEGGVIALTALVAERGGKLGKHLVLVGLFAAALLYGDGMITPAISVLSAIEGVAIVAPAFEDYVLPITVGILVGLFLLQRSGTAWIGTLFGPVTTVWLLTIAALGVGGIVGNPEILGAVSPHHAAWFLVHGGTQGFLVLGAVFLVVTGTEALYADMGHFGTRPIRLAWLGLVLPCLLLNYAGQGASLLANPERAEHVFYSLVPEVLHYPVAALATLATIIASQAVISGAFSLTRQAIQLGYLPRLRVVHTSRTEIGQVYVPAINWLLLVATVSLVLGFRSSSSLAAAYGVAVTTTMLVTSILFYVVATRTLGWPTPAVLALVALFVVVDLAFFAANVSKIAHGAWFPLVIGAAVFVLFTTWKRGRELLHGEYEGRLPTLEDFVTRLDRDRPTRVPGQAIYLVASTSRTPPALLNNLRHNHVVHERVAVVSVVFHEIPRVTVSEKVVVAAPHAWLHRIEIHYGFNEDPHVPRALTLARKQGFPFDPDEASYFLGRETVLPDRESGMAVWRERLFAFLSRNALDATSYFQIPPERVAELGAQVHL